MSGAQALPTKLVRKVATDSVLLSGLTRTGVYEFALTADTPRVHLLLNDSVPPHYDFYDVSLIVELGRQSLMAAAHAHLGVPFKRKLILTSFDLELEPPEQNPRQAVPAPIDIQMSLNPVLDGSELAGGTAQFRIEIDGRHRATSGGSFVIRTPGEYNTLRARVRERRDLPPLPEWAGAGSLEERELEASVSRNGGRAAPELVGRRNPMNVLIGEPHGNGSEATVEVLVDQLNAFFFDHPDEHVPGGLMIEAMRQMSALCAHRAHGIDPASAVVTRCRARFLGFAELELPLECTARLDPPVEEDGHVLLPGQFTLRQSGAKVGKCSMTVGFFQAGGER